MPAQLVSLGEGPNILVDKPILLIGRHPECDIQIDSRKISRRHCCIAQVNDYLVVRDLDSTNGIRINGVRVLEGQLREGDEVTIGGSRYRVTWDDVGPPPAAARPTRPPVDPDDDELEECDEPVPLVETARGQVPTARPPRAGPLPTVDEKQGPPILPSDLDLLPGSHPPKPPA